MNKIIIEFGWHCENIDKITVRMDWIPERQSLEPTALELASCPDIFTCYACGKKRPKDELAGEISYQRVCRRCAPYVSVREVGGWIRFDQKRGYRSYIRNY